MFEPLNSTVTNYYIYLPVTLSLASSKSPAFGNLNIISLFTGCPPASLLCLPLVSMLTIVVYDFGLAVSAEN